MDTSHISERCQGGEW